MNKEWPPKDLEAVSACPYCSSKKRTLAHQDVRDWSFGSAPGKWTYWNCQQCQALYLDPRPNQKSIGGAYGHYYTHGSARAVHLLSAIKQRLKNECWSHAFAASISPRFGVFHWGGWIFKAINHWVTEPFGLRQLAEMPKGSLIDVGCGNGDTLQRARQLGWRSLGIELDGSAVKAARAQGLSVIQGGYEELANHEGEADCVICSHVIEHVHEPLRLLRLLISALKPNGVLLLSAPNSSSYLRDHYAENWRGLEAPRHLTIPDAGWLMGWLQSAGLHCSQHASHDVVMAAESERIRRRGVNTVSVDVKAGKRVVQMKGAPSLCKQDIVQIICTKGEA